MKTLCLAACLLAAWPIFAQTEDTPTPAAVLNITLRDGSLIKAHPHNGRPRIEPVAGDGAFSPDWSLVREMKIDPANAGGSVFFKNADRLTFRWAEKSIRVNSAIGKLRIPVAEITAIEISGENETATNIALGKPVSGKDGASHGQGLAKHVTDGDYATHAKPPASNFDYRIDLRDGESNRFSIESIAVHWGRFGDRFKGVPKEGGGWKTASWPGEYVTSYTIEYRQVGSDEWLPLHAWKGRPVEEKAEGVEVQRLPTDQPGCSSEVITTIVTPDIQNIAEVRIRANGSHWIGLYELEVFGRPSRSPAP